MARVSEFFLLKLQIDFFLFCGGLQLLKEGLSGKEHAKKSN